MAFNATTLSAAIGASDTTIAVASATGITAPNFTSGTGIVYLFVETEVMLVLGVSGTLISVQRGVAGTAAAAHGTSTPVLAGLPADFGPIVPSVKATQDPGPTGNSYVFSAPVSADATITRSGPLFHLTGATNVATINLPAGYLEGSAITVVFDAANGFTTAGNISVATAGTTTIAANTAVSFVYDQGTSKWYPSRAA